MSIVLDNMEVCHLDTTEPVYSGIHGHYPPDDSSGYSRWLTIVSPDLATEVELALEPDQHPAARPFKMALLRESIPFVTFGTAEAQAEYQRLQEAGVLFSQPACYQGPVAMTVVYDTSGNMLQITQKH